MSTDLKYSLFLRTEDGQVVVKNREISAVLLVAVGSDRSYVCGALHPTQCIGSSPRCYGRFHSRT